MLWILFLSECTQHLVGKKCFSSFIANAWEEDNSIFCDMLSDPFAFRTLFELHSSALPYGITSVTLFEMDYSSHSFSSSTSLLLVFILLQKNFRELFYFHFETKKIWTIVHHTAIDSWSLFKYIETSQSKHTIANIQSAMQMNIYMGWKKMKWAEENKSDGRRMVWVSGALVHQLALCLGNKPCVECVYGKMKLKLFHIFTIHIPLLALSAPRLQFALSLVSTARMPRS